MNETNKEKPTPLKNVEEQERLKVKYEQESQEKEQLITKLQNTITKKKWWDFWTPKGKQKNFRGERWLKKGSPFSPKGSGWN